MRSCRSWQDNWYERRQSGKSRPRTYISKLPKWRGGSCLRSGRTGVRVRRRCSPGAATRMPLATAGGARASSGNSTGAVRFVEYGRVVKPLARAGAAAAGVGGSGRGVALDAAQYVTTGHAGSRPDAGAYESGRPQWDAAAVRAAASTKDATAPAAPGRLTATPTRHSQRVRGLEDSPTDTATATAIATAARRSASGTYRRLCRFPTC
jgi:hypothetical protein